MSNEYNVTLIEYKPSSIVRWIHDWPRKDAHNRDVDSSFEPTERQYWESIALAAAFFLAAAIVTLLFFIIRGLVRCCIICCKKSQEPEKHRTKPVKTTIVFYISIIIVIGALIYGFIANELVKKGILEVRDAIIDMDKIKDENVDAMDTILGDMDRAVNATVDLNILLISMQNDVGQAPQDVQEAIDSIQTNFNDQTRQIRDVLKDVRDIPIKRVTSDMKKYEGYRYLIQLAILIIISVPFIILVIGQFSKITCFLWNITWIGVLCACLAWILSGLEISACMVVADMCIDPSGYILDKAADLDSNTLVEYAEFYIICKDIPNPLQAQIDDAQETLDEARTFIDSLNDFGSQLLNASTPSTEARIQQAVALIDTISTNSDDAIDRIDVILDTVFLCNRVHNNYIKSLDGICNKTLKGQFGLLAVQTGLAIMIWVAIFCAIVLYRYIRYQKQQESDFPRSSAEAIYPPKNTDPGISGLSPPLAPSAPLIDPRAEAKEKEERRKAKEERKRAKEEKRRAKEERKADGKENHML